ncbi:hypothetical protein FB446DRAFT_773870 [Lentinula raphanica]|nr:hypothetical protein FB446DRAFT_773870 [Lentinula raphanica]
MANDIPPEIIESILVNLQSEEHTLSNCALVQKSWSLPAQRYLFQHIILEFPSFYPKKQWNVEHVAAYNERNEQLIGILDEKPFLKSCIRVVQLSSPGDVNVESGDHVQCRIQDTMYLSTIPVIERLDNVESLTLSYGDWDNLSLGLRETLIHLLSRPSLTRITLKSFSFSSLNALASVLSQASYLKMLRITILYCDDWDPPSSSISFAPRSIQLDESLCLRCLQRNPILTWLQQDSCPFKVCNLRRLMLDWVSFSDEEIASILQYIGGNLQELILEGPFLKAQSQYTASHISHTNNLRSLTVIGFLEPAPLLPIPWILNFFRHIQEFDVQKVSLRQLTLHISRSYGVSETPWTSDQQDEWTAVDTLFTEPRFNSLEMVNVKLAGYSRTAFNDVREILLGKMSLLEGLGKLKIELTSDYPYLH